METITKVLAYTAGAIVGLILGAVILALPVWLLWPYSGEALGLPPLDYFQTMALVFVCSVLFKNVNIKAND